jgi:hypothetical protein
MNRKTSDFGTGSFVGTMMRSFELFDAMPKIHQAQHLGWANGCPVPDSLITTNGQTGQGGAETMLRRYAAVNFWFKQLVKVVKDANPQLADTMMTPVQRHFSVGALYEPHNVPPSYYMLMPPLCNLPNYASARLIVSHIAGSERSRQPTAADRVVTGLDVIDSVARQVHMPCDFSARFAEAVTAEGMSQKITLQYMLPQNWLAQQNDIAMIDTQRQAMHDCAPTLSRYYNTLTPTQRSELAIL